MSWRYWPEDKLVPCGTPTAYKRHKARGEDACSPCIDAIRAYDRNRKRRKNAEKKAVQWQRPLMAAVPDPPAHTLPLPLAVGRLVELATDDIVRAFHAAMRGDYCISYTARDGLRLHLDPDDAHDWIVAAPMADDDDHIATVTHLPVGGAA
jgi:hypothetical protein